MSKVAQYLQEHIVGEVMTSADARKYFSTDGSVFELVPQIVVYPRTSADVRKVARFTWQLAERGRVLPITARGKGTDQAGGALGDGIILAFPAHMNKLLKLDKELATVQPGLIYGRLQETLNTHNRYLPPYPSSVDYCTIGGALANNSSGERSIKYGSIRNFAQSLEVVLANGEIIRTGRLSKRELGKKMGLTSMEGEIYRQLDALIMDNWELIHSTKRDVSKNSAGYDLADVKRKDGSFDLTPLFVGSQGTLGIITEADIKTAEYEPEANLLVGYFDSLEQADQAVVELEALKPCALEFIDINLLNFLEQHNPKQLAKLVDKPYPQIVLLVEFDDPARVSKKQAKKAQKILSKYARDVKHETDMQKREELWKIRHSAAAVIWQTVGTSKALPIVEDGIVPNRKFVEYVHKVYAMFDKYNEKIALWGHAGNANLHMQPFIDLSKVSERQKVFKIIDEYYRMVIDMGGSTSGEHNDGRLRAPYLQLQYGEEMYAVFKKTKQIFDPYGTLNPGVKIDVTIKDIMPLLRHEYSMEHLYDHMPRT